MSQGLTSGRLSQLQSYIEYNLSTSQIEFYTQNNTGNYALCSSSRKNIWRKMYGTNS